LLTLVSSEQKTAVLDFNPAVPPAPQTIYFRIFDQG
jgi:hypothetical protein